MFKNYPKFYVSGFAETMSKWYAVLFLSNRISGQALLSNSYPTSELAFIKSTNFSEEALGF